MDAALVDLATETRAAIARGELRGDALARRIEAVPARDRDTFVDHVLALPEPPPDDRTLPRGAVPYLPSAVDAIVAMVRAAPLGESDVLVDLGSGLGRVVILARLLAGARAIGVEVQGPLVAAAREAARALALDRVSFVHADATKEVPLGSAYFMYAPFNGALLVRALERIRERSRERTVTVITLDVVLPDAPWLERVACPLEGLVVHQSR